MFITKNIGICTARRVDMSMDARFADLILKIEIVSEACEKILTVLPREQGARGSVDLGGVRKARGNEDDKGDRQNLPTHKYTLDRSSPTKGAVFSSEAGAAGTIPSA